MDTVWCADKEFNTKCLCSGGSGGNISRNENHVYFSGCVCSIASQFLEKYLHEIESEYYSVARELAKKISSNLNSNISISSELISMKKYLMFDIQIDTSKKYTDDEIYEKVWKVIFKNNPVHFYITSFGGSLLHGFKMVDVLRNSPISVYTYCSGFVASAATLPFLYGKKRFFGKNAYFLIHQLSALMYGKYDELHIDMENKNMFMEHIVKIYKEKTSIPEEKINSLLKIDDWWSLEVCKKNGIYVEEF